LFENLEGQRPLRRTRSRCEDNIKMDLKEIVFELVGWVQIAQWLSLLNT
jgi:hypothetical protein